MEWTTEKVRETFINYFKEKQSHLFVPSSSVVPHDDPTLLFANAGMNQFKDIFLGTVDPTHERSSWKRAVNSQKCIRAGGKHNDLEDVGRDTYHHTFFEMLGSWSFGDYFKKEAIEWAWDLLVNVYKLDPNRLYVTYFRGDEANGIPEDLEAKQAWIDLGLSEDRVLPFGSKENFWEMGASGPCGPCSEIHYDRTEDLSGKDLVNADSPLVIEIWNLVFMQYNREEEGAVPKPLPAKHIDTGMGLERLTGILQKKDTNYGIDVFQDIFTAIQKISNAPPYTDKYGAEDVGEKDTAYRVVADHIRTITMAITDGALPSNVGRGYVLRRIIRRAVRIGTEKLFNGSRETFFHKLVPAVLSTLGGAFPELKNNPQRVQEVIRKEETKFLCTLGNGLRRFRQAVEGKEKGYLIPGDVAAKLFHTYGFPIDLTVVMAKERGMEVDEEGFKETMKEEKILSAGSGKKEKDPMALGIDDIAYLNRRNQFAPTDDNGKYEESPLEAKVVTIWTGKNVQGFVQSYECTTGGKYGLILDRTNFYGEQGGQVGDKGTVIVKSSGARLKVYDTQLEAGYVLHLFEVPEGAVKIESGEDVACEVDYQKRHPVMANHTTTHAVNFSLRSVLGDEVEQEGSRVMEDRFRFDFSHGTSLSSEELKKVDEIVQGQIEKQLPVFVKEVALEQASDITGIRAAFGEKYPPMVRVVCIGVSIDDLLADPENEQWLNYSVEFCGGTHLSNLSLAGSFCTISEEAVAQGIRRIQCVSGQQAINAIETGKRQQAEIDNLNGLCQKQQEYLSRFADAADESILEEATTLNIEVKEKAKEVYHTLESKDVWMPIWQRKNFRDQVADARKSCAAMDKEISNTKGRIVNNQVEKIIADVAGDSTFVAAKINGCGSDMKILKTAAASIQKAHPTLPVLLVCPDTAKDKFIITASVPKGSPKSAREWVSAALNGLGKGGGKNDSAQGVGEGAANIEKSLEQSKNYIS